MRNVLRVGLLAVFLVFSALIFGLFSSQPVEAREIAGNPVCAISGIATSTVSASSILVTWNDDCGDETSFQIGVSTNGTTYSTTSTAGASSASSTSATVKGLITNTQYWFRVAAANATATSSMNTIGSGTYTFANTPSAVTVGTPTITTLPITLIDTLGTTTTLATTYAVSVASTSWTGYLQPTGVLGAAASWITFAGLGSGTAATTTSGLKANVSYIVSIAGRNGDASSTAYTDATAKYTLANPPTSPSTSVGTGNVYATWTASDATKYYVENVNFSTANSGWISGTTYNFTTNLACGLNSFRVKGRNGDEVATAWADTFTGTVSCGGAASGGSGGVTSNFSSVSLSINSGATKTNTPVVKLALAANGAVKMMVANDVDFTGFSWVNYATSLDWTLAGTEKGIKTVYAKFKDVADVVSSVVSASIEYDPAAVIAPNTPAAAVATPATPAASTPVETTTPAVTVAAPSAPTSDLGIEEYLVVIKPDSAVQINAVNKLSLQPGTKLSFVNEYRNDTEASLKLKSITQILNPKGVVVYSKSNTKVVKVGDLISTNVSQLLGKTLAPGEYTVKVKVVNTKNNALLDDNSFKVTVEKLKKPTFVLGGLETDSSCEACGDGTRSDVYFDENSLAKNKIEATLPYVLTAKYGYTNNSSAKQTIKMVRELVDGNGKVLSSKSGKWVMQSGEKYALSFTQPITNLAAGSYQVRIKALDWNTKEVLAENGLGFSVEVK